MRRFVAVVSSVVVVTAAAPVGAQGNLYRSDAFTLTDTSVEQGMFRAIARSRESIVSNYQRAAGEVNFKFSINGLDNEHPPGDDYMIYLKPRNGRIVTPVYRFGTLEPSTTPAPELATASPEEGPVDVTFRLDMRHVFDSMRARGSYKPPNGEPIRQGGIEGIYVIGNTAPISWDFSKLVPGAPMQLHDPDGDGIYEVTLRFDATFSRPLQADGRVLWTLRRDLSRFPRMESPHRLTDALYNLALDELVDLERDDGTLNAGGRWPGVWTRDLVWSALLGVVLAAPDAVRRGLLVRVDSLGRIIQDSGTGGSWPLSTDRVTWALAAWELYAVTGDTAWLRTAYPIIRRSLEADLAVAFDSASGLFRGESTFLDWRDQSYPRWMDAKDIGASQALGTNVLHYGAYRALGRMARVLGEPSARWDRIADAVTAGLNREMWQQERGYFGQYLYGGHALSLSPRAEHLGEALSIVLGAASSAQSQSIVRKAPVIPFGVPSFWPYIPGIPPYHNAGVWPQVVGFWGWAAADAGNAAAVEFALANLYRAAGLFLTNKENWVAPTGHFEGTEVNSDRFQASAAAQLGATYRVLFGIRLEPDRMRFQPLVPRAYAGTRTLRNLRYRGATLTVIMHGFGDQPRQVKLNGRVIPFAEIPATLAGDHVLEITLDESLPPGSINVARNVAAPRTPQAVASNGRLTWNRLSGARSYHVYRNGRRFATTRDTTLAISGGRGLAEYQVLAVDSAGLESFLSAPVRTGADASTRILEPPRASLETEGTGYEGSGYVTLTMTSHNKLSLRTAVATPGWYLIDARYANGNGPISYGYRAAARGLAVNGRRAGTLVMPQRGNGRWNEWGYTNAIRTWLDAGEHELTVIYAPEYRNMDGTVDSARLDHLRIVRLAGSARPRTTQNER